MNPANYLIPILDMYCEWLNRWVESDGVTDHRYTIHDFTITDPDRHLWGQAIVRGVIPNTDASSAFPRFMVIISCTDGDEGGGHDLTAWFELNTDDNTSEIVALCQGFDTNLQFIYEDRQWRNLPR
jgi:hypothetical protein